MQADKPKTNYLPYQQYHVNNTKPRTNSNFNTPLFNHLKTHQCYLNKVSTMWNSLPSSFKNCNSKFILKKKLKAIYMRPNHSYFLIIKVSSSILIIYEYMSLYLALPLILKKIFLYFAMAIGQDCSESKANSKDYPVPVKWYQITWQPVIQASVFYYFANLIL